MTYLSMMMLTTGILFILYVFADIDNDCILDIIRKKANVFYKKADQIGKKISYKRRKSLIEDELYRSASLLENIVKLQKNSPKGAVYIIEQISSYSRELRKPFENMLYYLSINNKDAAVHAFERECGTKSAKDYGDILIKMDSINPSELKDSISLLRRRLREEAVTREKNKNEVMSDLIYIPVLANIMLIFINFIYISYYAEQREIFQQLLF